MMCAEDEDALRKQMQSRGVDVERVEVVGEGSSDKSFSLFLLSVGQFASFLGCGAAIVSLLILLRSAGEHDRS